MNYKNHMIARELIIKTLDYMDASQIKGLNDSDNDIRFLRMQPEQEMIFWDIIERERGKDLPVPRPMRRCVILW